MALDTITDIGKEKTLKYEIVKCLSARNAQIDFGVNPKSLAEEISNNGFDTKAIDVGHALKQLGFVEVMNRGGRNYRAIRLKTLRKLEYLMLAENDADFEKVKPTIIYLYHKGYDATDKAMRKLHDGIAEPLRLRAGRWFCQSSKKEINDYIEKCKAEGFIPNKLLEAFDDKKDN